MSINQLIHCLQNNSPIFHRFKSYRGTDWKSLILYHSKLKPCSRVLFQSHDTKLIVTGWHLYQFCIMETPPHAIIHSLVLEGGLYYNMKSSKNIILPHTYHYLHEDHECQLLAVQPSASLHLIQLTDDMY